LADERAPKQFGNANSSGGRRTLRHDGFFAKAEGSLLSAIPEGHPAQGKTVDAPAKMRGSVDRPTDRKLSKSLGRSVQAIQQRRSCLSRG
jgi:hypothetical protein